MYFIDHILFYTLENLFNLKSHITLQKCGTYYTKTHYDKHNI